MSSVESPSVESFYNVDGWFDSKYRDLSSFRFPTFKAALNIVLQCRDRESPPIIVETGCVRLPDDWGAGMSTVLFGDFATTYGGSIHTCDISQANVSMCQKLTEPYADSITYHVGDSVEFLSNFSDHIDLLYLDSYDFPVHENARFAEIDAPQQHCLNELLAAWDKIGHTSVILLDDNNLPYGGKPRLAKFFLAKEGWTCVYDHQQSLWVRGH
jgi:hypothetical protein